ncbi:MAG: hypothetical protein AUK55_12775 [Syntrophobacteraceae bacterium CG2_30_61_12]|nr:MAG: hypothetical protein AUK55_12775 [Syntrophobacteraceae bacterium CG2_30_61_12]PIU32137.1 MAG: hypothetical protein COT06_04325 [Syntrophobacteraceae bacterium CG07_land_8_20_14_0_80_61_8]
MEKASKRKGFLSVLRELPGLSLFKLAETMIRASFRMRRQRPTAPLRAHMLPVAPVLQPGIAGAFMGIHRIGKAAILRTQEQT